MTAILHPFAPLLDNFLVEQSLEVGINVVGINVHCIGVAENGGGARSQRQIVTNSTCLALVVVQVSELQVNQVAVGLKHGIVFCHNQGVQKPVDVIGIQGLFGTIKQILI
jgi:hypothetical protein